jgi:amino acid permease
MGAIMSICYCGIATVVSGLHKPSADVHYQPGLGKPRMVHTFAVFNAITTMLFAYGGHNIALEIQATLPAPPSTVRRMMRGVNAAFVLTGICYLCVSITGFHAFGIAVPDNVLAGFGDEYKWPVALANIFVVIHVAAAYQVYSQPVFDMVELAAAKTLGRPVNQIMRVIWRIIYVAVLTLIAVLIPFFGSLMGLVGAIGITPTTFLLPCLLWVLYRKPKRFSRSWCVNWFLVVVTGVIGFLGTVGSIYEIHRQSKSYSLFGN